MTISLSFLVLFDNKSYPEDEITPECITNEFHLTGRRRKYEELSHTVETCMKNHGYHMIGIATSMVFYIIHGHEAIFKVIEFCLVVDAGTMASCDGCSYHEVIELCI